MIYTYKCEEHGKFEINQSISETKPEAPCPQCGKMATKVIVAVNFNCPSSAGKKPKKINTKDDWITRQNKDRWI